MFCFKASPRKFCLLHIFNLNGIHIARKLERWFLVCMNNAKTNQSTKPLFSLSPPSRFQTKLKVNGKILLLWRSYLFHFGPNSQCCITHIIQYSLYLIITTLNQIWAFLALRLFNVIIFVWFYIIIWKRLLIVTVTIFKDDLLVTETFFKKYTVKPLK